MLRAVTLAAILMLQCLSISSKGYAEEPDLPDLGFLRSPEFQQKMDEFARKNGLRDSQGILTLEYQDAILAITQSVIISTFCNPLLPFDADTTQEEYERAVAEHPAHKDNFCITNLKGSTGSVRLLEVVHPILGQGMCSLLRVHPAGVETHARQTPVCEFEEFDNLEQ